MQTVVGSGHQVVYRLTTLVVVTTVLLPWCDQVVGLEWCDSVVLVVVTSWCVVG